MAKTIWIKLTKKWGEHAAGEIVLFDESKGRRRIAEGAGIPVKPPKGGKAIETAIAPGPAEAEKSVAPPSASEKQSPAAGSGEQKDRARQGEGEPPTGSAGAKGVK